MNYFLQIDRGSDGDALVSLRHFLSGEDELRGVVAAVDAAETGEHLGSITDVLQVAVGSGAAVTTLISSITAWIQSRGSDIDVTVTGPDGRAVTIDADRLKKTDLRQLGEFVARISAELDRADSATTDD